MREEEARGTSLSHDQEPIVALASGQGLGPIAVLRVSGQGCHALLRRCLARHGAPLSGVKDRYLHYCDFIDPATQRVIDDPLVCFFTGPHSYTGQDSAEISLHGSPYIISTVTSILLQQGFRPAEAGEFTRRAFLQGKMDLSAAEGVRELLSATSHQQWLAARQMASGQLQRAIDHLRATLLAAQGWLAARIDFPDEKETSEVSLEEVSARVDLVAAAIRALLSTYNSGHIARGGLKIALVGDANAGKSTLLNTLLGKNRAIVSPVPGTTRDYLEESAVLDGRLLRLTDTAGLRATSCAVEEEGIARSLAIAAEADMVLLLFPSDGSVENFRAQQQRLRERGIAFQLVRSKSDLALSPELAQAIAGEKLVSISCLRAEGLDALRDFIVGRVDQHVQMVEEHVCISSARHKHALEQAQQAIAKFYTAAAEEAYDELLAFELQQASAALDSIVGTIAADDILGEVFSTFCVGK